MSRSRLWLILSALTAAFFVAGAVISLIHAARGDYDRANFFAAYAVMSMIAFTLTPPGGTP